MNDKKKNPLEGIFAQVTDDDLLRENGLLYAENKQLQSNWNSLRNLIEKEMKKSRYNNDVLRFTAYEWALDKMNELERKDNGNKSKDI